MVLALVAVSCGTGSGTNTVPGARSTGNGPTPESVNDDPPPDRERGHETLREDMNVRLELVDARDDGRELVFRLSNHGATTVETDDGYQIVRTTGSGSPEIVYPTQGALSDLRVTMLPPRGHHDFVVPVDDLTPGSYRLRKSVRTEANIADWVEAPFDVPVG